MFDLSEDRFERRLDRVGIEIWRISIAIGFAENRKIFCFPWLNMHSVSYIESYIKYIEILKKHGAIVLAPSSQEAVLRRFCDGLLLFRYDGVYFE
jgi:hypothetical protein